jgi:hypothetical protein
MTATSYTIEEIAGASKIRVPIIKDNDEQDESGVKSPEWMVKIDDFLTSNIDGFNDHTELYGWYAQSSRHSTGKSGSSIPLSATLKHSDLIVVIPNGAFAVQLEMRMNTGTPLSSVCITRLGNIKVSKVKLQTIEFAKCTIKSFQQELDRLVLHLTVTTKTNTVFVFGDDGSPKGQNVSRVDYSKNIAE